MVAGECWPAVNTPSMSPTRSPASRTALWMASTWSVSWLLCGRAPSSSLSSTPTMHAAFDSSFTGSDRCPCGSRRGWPERDGWLSLRHRLEHWQGDLVGLLLEYDLDRHVAPDLRRIRRDVDEICQHARALVELDHREHDGSLHLEGLVEDLVGDLERVHASATAGADPLDVAGGTERADNARVHEHLAAGAALRNHEASLARAVPVRLRLGRHRGRERTLELHAQTTPSWRIAAISSLE